MIKELPAQVQGMALMFHSTVQRSIDNLTAEQVDNIIEKARQVLDTIENPEGAMNE